MKPVFCGVILSFLFLNRSFAQVVNNDGYLLKNIPPSGLLLDRNWRFHAGDNLNWKNSNINDSGWKQVNPNIEIHELLKSYEGSNTGWFRLKLNVDSSLQDSTMALVISQVVASEIYLDGKLLLKLGTVSEEFNKEHTLRLHDQPFIIHFSKKQFQELALHYSFNQRIFFIHFEVNPCVSLILKQANQSFADSYVGKIINYALAAVIFSLYFLLGLFCLYFYVSFRRQRAFLFISIDCLGQAIGVILYMISLNSAISISISSHLYILANTISSICFVFILNALYLFFQYPRSRYYPFFILYTIAAIPLSYMFFSAARILICCFAALAALETIPISIKGIRMKRPGSWLVLLSNIFSEIFLLGNIYLVVQGDYTNATYVASFVFIIVPIYLSFFMAGEFARSGLALQSRIKEVEELSQKVLNEETEKQLILASQNENLELQVQQRTSELNKSLSELKSTQAQLIQAEKMASLGELTAGIAHEIQNPLNFVNNFSEVNKELIDEASQANATGNVNEVEELLSTLKDNEEKISHHGKRADAIVKGMLEHSRETTGLKELTDINALTDEYLLLAYHGIRSKDNSFNVTMNTDFDKNIGNIKIIPQDIGRVLLNIYNNAFYTVSEKKKAAVSVYEPTISVSTKGVDNKVTITIKDNGCGIPQKVVDKIFQPFFTTKPTGQGTGLGLSLSYDIIKAHNGEIRVNSKEGEFTEFIIALPT